MQFSALRSPMVPTSQQRPSGTNVRTWLFAAKGQPCRHHEWQGQDYIEGRSGATCAVTLLTDGQLAKNRDIIQNPPQNREGGEQTAQACAKAGDSEHRSVTTAVECSSLEETELTKKPKTLAAYTTALNFFTESCPSPTRRHRSRRPGAYLQTEFQKQRRVRRLSGAATTRNKFVHRSGSREWHPRARQHHFQAISQYLSSAVTLTRWRQGPF